MLDKQETGFVGAEESFGPANSETKMQIREAAAKGMDESKLKGRSEFKLNLDGVSANALKSAATPQKPGAGVPKLNLKGLKQNQEYRDWYQYALKLEDSVKFLRQRIEVLEEDLESANSKYRQEKKANAETLEINQRLVAALNTAK